MRKSSFFLKCVIQQLVQYIFIMKMVQQKVMNGKREKSNCLPKHVSPILFLKGKQDEFYEGRKFRKSKSNLKS